eukprot:TRINITY_DN17076_c0_g1_i1.p1 TRINITY_DN17076_c0_g1~~TRINITY_DN17076_c0_g1_i1.p1  ORF type:complete len:208 (-),score=61.21 TRINITY_DN17076_c0_g1_i1:118-741(-)
MFYSLTIFTILCMRIQAGPVTTTKPDEDHFHVAAGDLEALLEELTTKHPKDISIVHTNEIKAGNPLDTLLTGGEDKVDELEDKLEEVEDLLKDLHEDFVENQGDKDKLKEAAAEKELLELAFIEEAVDATAEKVVIEATVEKVIKEELETIVEGEVEKKLKENMESFNNLHQALVNLSPESNKKTTVTVQETKTQSSSGWFWSLLGF